MSTSGHTAQTAPKGAPLEQRLPTGKQETEVKSKRFCWKQNLNSAI